MHLSPRLIVVLNPILVALGSFRTAPGCNAVSPGWANPGLGDRWRLALAAISQGTFKGTISEVFHVALISGKWGEYIDY